MTFNSYDVGDPVEVSATFDLSNGDKIDPPIVKVKIKDPSGAEFINTYGTDVAVERTGEGEYRFIVPAELSKFYAYDWIAEDSSDDHRAGAEGGLFYVKQSMFVNAAAGAGAGSGGGIDGGEL